MLLGDGAENPFRLHAAQEHGLAAREEAAEPMHLRARVIQRRDAEKDVLMRLAVVVLLDQTGMIERAVVMQNGLRKARRAAGEIDCGKVVLGQADGRHGVGAEAHPVEAILGKVRRVFADIEEIFHAAELRSTGLHALGEFRPNTSTSTSARSAQ